jgi:arylsulfatase A-like enzyme
LDLLPTFAEIAGTKIAADRPLDGVSITDVLFAGKRLPKRQVFFGYEPKLGTAMRDGEWKMIVKEDQVRLFHLGDDLGEQKNLVEKYPKRVASMLSAIERWKEETTLN